MNANEESMATENDIQRLYEKIDNLVDKMSEMTASIAAMAEQIKSIPRVVQPCRWFEAHKEDYDKEICGIKNKLNPVVEHYNETKETKKVWYQAAIRYTMAAMVGATLGPLLARIIERLM